LAFARAASVVDVRNGSCAHRRIEQFYFVDFSNEICDGPLRVLADQERLIIGQTPALRRGVEGRRHNPVHVRFPARSRTTNNRYGDMMPLSVAQVCAQPQEVQMRSVGQLDAQLPIE
jgi:hypothetical protein